MNTISKDLADIIINIVLFVLFVGGGVLTLYVIGMAFKAVFGACEWVGKLFK
jgi:hypothetical protein